MGEIAIKPRRWLVFAPYEGLELRANFRGPLRARGLTRVEPDPAAAGRMRRAPGMGTDSEVKVLS